jgi:hypothetical protein
MYANLNTAKKTKRIIGRNVNRIKPAEQVKDIDPEVEILSAMIQQSGLTDKQIARRVSDARKSRMSSETVRAIRELAVRRPHNYTFEWVGFALGMKRMWVPIH